VRGCLENKAQRTGGVAQVVYCLRSKCTGPESKPLCRQKKKKKKKKKKLGPEIFQNFFLQILEYFQTHNKLSWEWAPSLNKKLSYVPYTPYTHSLKMILYFLYSAPEF
jgi:hypothetical protein